MQITAEERGRRLVLTVGGPTPDMTDEEAAEASEDVVRVSVPPVSARIGAQLFAFYTGITFARADALTVAGFEGTTEDGVIFMSRLALSALPLSDEDGGDDAQRARAEARWDLVQGLRFEEASAVCNAALFWNVQGGNLEAATAALRPADFDEEGEPVDGIPFAMRRTLEANGVWGAFQRLTTLLSSESESPTPSPDGSSATSTPTGSSANSPSDEPQPEPTTPTRETSSPPAKKPARKRAPRSTGSPSGSSRSDAGTTSPPSTSTSDSSSTTRTNGSGTTDPGAGSTPASEDSST